MTSYNYARNSDFVFSETLVSNREMLKEGNSLLLSLSKNNSDKERNLNRINNEIKFYQSFDRFYKDKKNHRIVLMTTKASISYTKFKFEKNDTILFGRESAGVPEKVHGLIKNKLKIPMKNNKRSLNISSSVAIILAESLKQTNLI